MFKNCSAFFCEFFGGGCFLFLFATHSLCSHKTPPKNSQKKWKEILGKRKIEQPKTES
ncbi:hypothetical protein BACSTE_00822 [Bacteroides stercoris ATCC 43183]|uniref:Uncharacterized protein n=1 Tax=Bacteroides stercoris ATCC 43183 TaxID=449673 RepID=B0NN27_BACSE|nr:hypothetical protein BACSTE_00822 [Bacteroides stercoris ATCC 43183]